MLKIFNSSRIVHRQSRQKDGLLWPIVGGGGGGFAPRPKVMKRAPNFSVTGLRSCLSYESSLLKAFLSFIKIHLQLSSSSEERSGYSHGNFSHPQRRDLIENHSRRLCNFQKKRDKSYKYPPALIFNLFSHTKRNICNRSFYFIGAILFRRSCLHYSFS